jgi:hypothetical protein
MSHVISETVRVLSDTMSGPYYDHDCEKCVYLGSIIDGDQKIVDLYFCPKGSIRTMSIIARYSSDGPDYASSHIGYIERYQVGLYTAMERTLDYLKVDGDKINV